MELLVITLVLVYASALNCIMGNLGAIILHFMKPFDYHKAS
jgi:hypothetical protein